MSKVDNRFSFTSKNLNSITERGAYYDDHKDANGLIYNIQTDNKTGSFIVRERLNGKKVTITIGRYPKTTIEQARKKARTIQTDFSNGINPNIKKKFDRTKQITLIQMFEKYLQAKKLKPMTIRGYQISFKNVLAPLANKELTAITYDNVQDVHTEYSERSQAEADRAMRLLRAIFYMAMDDIKDLDGRPLILENPVRKLGKNKHFTKLDRKTRKLEDDQIKPFLECIESLTKDPRPFYQSGADLLLILLYHGTRFTETASIKWNQIDFRYKRFYLTETKSGRRLWLPITIETEKVLKRRKRLATGSEYIFPSATDPSKHISDVKKPLRHILEQTGIEITPHDLRRTFLSNGTRLGISDYVLKQLANHAPSNDVTAGYVIQNTDELQEPSQQIVNALFEKAGRNISDGDSLLSDLLSALSENDKRKLILQLSNTNKSQA